MASAISLSNLFSSKPATVTRKNFVPSIFIQHSAEDKLKEEFKSAGVVNDKKTTEQTLKNIDKDIKTHPFDYEQPLGLYKQFGPVTGVVDKYTDFILGPGFFVKSDDSRASEIVNQHIVDFNLYNVMNEVIRLAIPAGTTAVEMKKDPNTGVPNGYKIIPPKTFYIKENEKGTRKGYVQILNMNTKEAIELDLDDVAVFTINKMGTYGMGIIYPAMTSINNIMRSSKDLHTLQSRKANSPVWWKLGGVVDGLLIEPGAGDVESFGQELEYMNNKTEFCTGPLVEASVIDYGPIGEKFGFVLEYDWKMFRTAVQVPEVLLGDGNVNEGIAKVQMDAFERRIRSLQEELEKVMESQIFNVILEANGLDGVKVEVVWGLPSNLEKNAQLDRFAELLNNPLLSFELREELEKRIAEILEIDLVLENPKQEREREEEQQKQPIVPGQQKQPLKQITKEHVCDHKNCSHGLYEKDEFFDKEEELKKDYSIKEWLGWSYVDFKEEIGKAIERDDFSQVLGKTVPELAAGKLTETQIVALKQVLKDGISNDLTMKEISNNIRNKVKPRTLWKLDQDGKLVKKNGKNVLQLSAKFRPMMIARTSIVDVSNKGALVQYTKMGAEKVKWIAAVSERTCEICLGLDGTVYNIGEANVPPEHPMCRCLVDYQIPILTSKGWKKVGDIKVDDLVLSHKGKFKKVNKLINGQYNGEVVKVFTEFSKFKNNDTKHFLTTTPEHPYLLSNGKWKDATDLKIGDEVMVLGEKCKECNELYPIFFNKKDNNFCSQECFNRNTANIQFKDLNQHLIRSEKASKQMYREYENGTRDKYEIIKKAREQNSINRKDPEKKIVFAENRKIMIDTCKEYYGGNCFDEKVVKKLKDRCGEKNPMHKSKHSEEFWENISKNKKEYYKNNPDKLLNRIISQKATDNGGRFVSKPQRKLFKLVKNIVRDDVELEYLINTNKSHRFLDIAIPSKKIDIEYSGKYWHKDKQKDLTRKKEIEEMGWTVITYNEDNIHMAEEELRRILKNHNNEYLFVPVKITEIKKWKLKKPRKRYNLSIDDDESYIAKGFVNHNCSLVPVVE